MDQKIHSTTAYLVIDLAESARTNPLFKIDSASGAILLQHMEA